MNKFKLFSLLMAFTLSLSAQQIQVDEERGTVTFLFVDDDVDGTLSDFKFTGNVDLGQLESATIAGTVASETIDTDNWLRDRHLRRKYFEVDDYPLLKFKSTSIIASEDVYIVKGSLTMKGIEKEVTFTLSKKVGKLVLEASINASHFNINIHDEVDRNKVDIVIVLPY